MTASESVRVVSKLQAAYPQREVTPATTQVYAEALADLPLDEALAAVAEIVATCRWFPTISEIRERVAEARCGAPEPDQAYAEVRVAVRSHGRARLPQWSHPAIAEAVRSIGWSALCDSERPGVERAHFLSAYKATRERAVRAEQRLQLRAGRPALQIGGRQ